jgi:hypothetical protein
MAVEPSGKQLLVDDCADIEGVVDLNPRSAESSSRPRHDGPNRRYQRTADWITSGGNRNPAKTVKPCRIDG